MASKNEIGVKVTGDPSGAIKALDSIEANINELKDKTVNIGVGGDGETKINEIKDKSDKLGSETQTVKVDADTSGAESQINNLKQELVDLQDLAAGIVIGGAVTGIADTAMSQDEAMAKIRGSIGGTTSDVEQMAMSIYKATGADWATVADAMIQVRTQTGATGSELEDLTLQSIKFSKIWDEDVREVIRANNEIARTFGLTNKEAFGYMQKGFEQTGDPADDLLDTLNEYDDNFASMGYSAQEFFNILVSGIKHGIMNTDQMADAVREAMIRLTTSPDERQKVYDLIGASAEQQQRWNEMIAAGGDQAQQAFEEIVGSIDSIQDPLKRNEAAVALFGSKFEDQGDAIIDSIVDQTDYVGDAGDAFEDAANRGTSAWDQLVTSIKQLPGGEWLVGAVEGLGQFLTEGLGQVLSAVLGVAFVDWIRRIFSGETTLSETFQSGMRIGQRVIDGIRSGIGNLGEKIFKGGGMWGDEAGQAGANIGRAIEGSIQETPGIFEKLRNLGGRITDTIKGWKAPWSSAAEDGAITMVKNADGVWEMKTPGMVERVSKLGELIPDGWFKGLSIGNSKLAGKIGGITGAIGGFLIDGLANAGQIYENDTNTAILKLTGIYGIMEGAGLAPYYEQSKLKIQEWSKALGISWMPGLAGFDGSSNLRSLMTALFGADTAAGIGDFLTNRVEVPFRQQLELMGQNPGAWFGDTFNMLGRDMWNAGAGMGTNLSDGLTSAQNYIQNGLGQIWSQITGFFSGGWEDFYNWGKNTLEAWIKGITDTMSNAGSQLKTGFDNFIKWLKGESPPKEGPLQDIDLWGVNVGSAYVEGINEGISKMGVLNNGLNVLSNFLPTMASQKAVNSSSIQVTVNLAGANIASNLDATSVGEKVGSGLASKLAGQASNAGVNVVNVQR